MVIQLLPVLWRMVTQAETQHFIQQRMSNRIDHREKKPRKAPHVHTHKQSRMIQCQQEIASVFGCL